MALTLALVACSDDDDAVADASSLCELAGSTEKQGATPEDEDRFLVTSVRHEVVEDGCEQLIFELEPVDGGTSLGYHASYREGPLPGPSGPVEVDGAAALGVVLQQTGTEASAASDLPQPDPESHYVVDIVPLPDVPGGSVWAFGVSEERPFTISVEGSSPLRLVITFLSGSDG